MSMRQASRAAAALVCVTLSAALTSCASAHHSQPAAEPVAAAASAPLAAPLAASGHLAPRRLAAANAGGIPGNDPSIQHWFLKLANSKVAFDNALLQAEHGIAQHVSSMCKPLSQTVQPILSALPSLRHIPSPAGTAIADAIEPGLQTFSQMGDLCASGNFAGAQALLPTGVQQQADGQATVDEILDGDANPGGTR